MTIERAIEILDPTHREWYDSIETVEEACRMGMEALKKQIPKKIGKHDIVYDIDTCLADFCCPTCNGMNCNNLLKPNYCKYCGQALDFGR